MRLIASSRHEQSGNKRLEHSEKVQSISALVGGASIQSWKGSGRLVHLVIASIEIGLQLGKGLLRIISPR
jgi:hypothetical protein